MAAGNYSQVLVVTPNATDSDLARSFLAEGGIQAGTCSDLMQLCQRLVDGVGCIVLVQEALTDEEMPVFREALEAQPAWSDIPLVLVAGEGAELSALVERAFPDSGNITLLERPLNPLTLLSAVHVGLRARDRQLQVRDLLSQREEALRQRDEFVAMLAHELRNPLAPMRNAVYLQQNLETDDPVLIKTRDIVGRQVAHLSHLVDDLLDVARLERGKVELQTKRMELNAAVTASLEAFLPMTHAAGLLVQVNLASEPLALDADPVRIEQLLSNLITNAVKFTPRGGEITIETRRENRSAVVSVRDTGVGIGAEMIDEMFKPFTQGDQTLARSAGGLGIGLTIARRLAQLHGGTLSANSDGTNKGATFIAEFPLAIGHQLAQTEAAPVFEPAGQGKRVLVVDDSADIRESFQMLLSLWGHEVITADDGITGVQLAACAQPDFAFIDIGLPGMSGYEVAKAIRTAASKWDSSIRLVAVTGYGQPGDRARAFAAGFDNHLLKPVDPTILERMLDD
jgi:signal transduction histidine kinase